MMFSRATFAIHFALAAVIAPAAHAAPAASLLYRQGAAVVLPGSSPGYDYIKFEPGTSRLFIARDADGLTVLDVDTSKTITTVGNSAGANGPLLLPQFRRGYVAMTDGSLLSLSLDTLKPIARLPLAKSGGLNSGVLEPTTGLIHFITASGTTQSTWYTLDPASGKLLKETVFPFRKMDDPATDGSGHIYAPVRYDRLILKLKAATLQEHGRWRVDCDVSKLKWQASTQRLLGACGGSKPSFFAFDPKRGVVTAQLPIGRGIDGFVIDESRRRIVTSNGEDASLTVIEQRGPDEYRLLGSVATRPGARMMEIDPRTGGLFVVAQDFTLIPPARSGEEESEIVHADSFTVHRYDPK